MRNMCALHSPMPFTAVSSAMTSSSLSVVEALELELAGATCSASERRNATFARDSPAAARIASGSAARISLAASASRPPKRSSSRASIDRAARADSCWPTIERTSAA